MSSHQARFFSVRWHQLRSPLLALLLTAALASYFVGERSDAIIIGIVVALSVDLGFVNEYRAEKAAEALHDQIHHVTVVTRDGSASSVDVIDLVPGDIVQLRLGDVVPADLRLLEVHRAGMRRVTPQRRIATGRQSTDHVARDTPLAALTGCALMGTVVNSDTGRGIVVSTGARTSSARPSPD